jgi:hypothetical protein
MPATIQPIIDGPEQQHADSETCIRRYIVHGVLTTMQKPQFRKEYAAGADWPSGYKVIDWKEKAIVYSYDAPANAVWELIVTGSTTLSGVGFGDTNSVLKRDNPVRGLTSVAFAITDDHVGARRAKDADAGIFTDPETGEVCWRETDLWAIPKDKVGAMYTYCEEDDWIYKNGSPAFIINEDGEWTAVTETVGTPDIAHAPFLYTYAPAADDAGIVSTNPLRLRHIGNAYDCLRHQITFWVETDRLWRDNAPSSWGFHGRVNDWGPLSGAKYGPISPSGTLETQGQWKCESEEIGQDFDIDGERLLKITRTFIRVPAIFGFSGVEPYVIWNSSDITTLWAWDYS